MLNIKKTLLIRAISLLLSISIALPSVAYSLPENQSNALRVPLDKNYNRVEELLTIYSEARIQSTQPFTMANIWSMLLGNEEARIGELKGKITWRGSDAGKIQDKFEHTQMLVEFEKGLDINRGDIEAAKAVVLNRKDSSLSGLDGSKIEEFLKYYYNISQEELKILRFAIVLHDLGGIYGRGEDAFAGRKLSEPVLARFVKEGLIIEEEKKVILALYIFIPRLTQCILVRQCP